MSSNGSGNVIAGSTNREVLHRVIDLMQRAGFYAYLHLDDQNRWSVSADTEEGHADVRLEGGWFVVEVWDTSPGLFWEETNERRFYAQERRARIVMPTIARGLAKADQEIWWDETDHGVGARLRTAVDLELIARIPVTIRQQFDELNLLLGEVERRLLD